jgi:hypothetical protein
MCYFLVNKNRRERMNIKNSLLGKNQESTKDKLIGYLTGTIISIVVASAAYLFLAYTCSTLFAKRSTETIRGIVVDKEYVLTYGNMGGSTHLLLNAITIQTDAGEREKISIYAGNDFADSEIHKSDLVEFKFIYKEPARIWTPFGRITEYTERNGKTLCDMNWEVKKRAQENFSRDV